MILMNYHCAQEMMVYKNGIFRSTILKKEVEIPASVPEDVSKFIKIMKSSSGQYMDGATLDNSSFQHQLLDLDAYIHITSPIRRLVDLLNIIQFQENKGLLKLSEKSKQFHQDWLQQIDYINETMRSIRKVQFDCSLLDLCVNSPPTMEKEYEGYLFDRLERTDGLYQYSVFLPELKLSSRITLREDFINYTYKKFKLFLFQDEENFKKKIRLQLIHF
jgi:exoribonuclease R